MITVVMMGAPVPWARTRPNKAGALFTPARQRNAAAMFRVLAQQAMAGRPPIDDAVRVDIIAEMPIPESTTKRDRAAIALERKWPSKKPDFDNIAKLIIDAGNGIIWIDDKQIVDCRIRKLYNAQPKLTLRCVSMAELQAHRSAMVIACSHLTADKNSVRN